MTLDEFFAGQEQSRQLFDALRQVVEAIGRMILAAEEQRGCGG